MLSQYPNKHEIAKLVEEQILQVLEEKDTNQHPVPDNVLGEHRLGPDLGLSSLDLAQLVVGLEMRLSADPFAELVPITSVRTVGDLCSAYEQFFSGETVSSGQTEALRESKRRAELRRSQNRP